ncbi:hypothetical protein AB0420_18210 [Streptomyces caelestis]|uniref:Plasmid replication protein RepL domain-containing protein n=1 Tax=Streptomyces heliomycini TaxID=284032 RepID=A0ABV5L199_9ACTN|nr:hypothetical protein [Streptomyces sp. XY152]
MPPSRRSVAVPGPRRAVRLSPVAYPSRNVLEDQSRTLLKALEKISRNGGTIVADPSRKGYAFPGGKHLALSTEIHENLWRFKLSPMARDLLDHIVATHDEDGLVRATQQGLGAHFQCHRSKISRAMKMLDTHNFAWKHMQGQYQLNPCYAYRWGSRKQHALVARITDVLKARTIQLPLSETRNR